MERRTALWLSHHWPEQYDRCVRVGHSHVCRRCGFFWPVCLATMVLALAGVRWPITLDPWLIALLPVPVVTEWWVEQLDLVGYSPTRQVALTLLGAPAVGVGLARYLESPGDTLFWAVVAAYAIACLAPVLIGHSQRRKRTDSTEQQLPCIAPDDSTAHLVCPELRHAENSANDLAASALASRDSSV